MPQLDEAGDDPPPTTPRKASVAKNGTPQRRTVSGKKVGTPNSAPARGAPKAKKGAEATLLGDFLLGRQSANRTPNRARRKTSEAIPLEMKAAAVNKLQSPGGVKDRVKQWQKATIVVPGAVDTAVSDGEEEEEEEKEIVVVIEEESVVEHTPVKARKPKSEGNKVESPPILAKAAAKAAARPQKPKSAGVVEVAAPKKRVVSDDHWMQKKKKRSPPRKVTATFKPLPENFVRVNTAIPPLSKKISNWASNVEPPKQPDFRAKTPKEDEDPPQKTRVSQTPARDNDGIRIFPGETESVGDSTSIRDASPEQSLGEDSVMNKPSSGKLRGAGFASQNQRKSKSDSPKEKDKSPERKGETEENLSCSETSDDQTSASELPLSAKLRGRKGSLEDIPVGYSAFSVLDMPIGGEARTMRRPKPQPKRSSSFNVVPKVFKKVYAEAQKIVNETVDPPRIGVNQPASIESWLKGTSDPFVDDALDVPVSSEDASRTKQKRPSFEPGDAAESVFTAEPQDKISEEKIKDDRARDLDSLPTMQTPGSPSNLKRRPANRMSPGQSTRRTPLKERLAEAFHGQSSVKTPLVYKSESDYSDIKEDRPPHLDMGLGEGFTRSQESNDCERRASLNKGEPEYSSRAENPVRRTQAALGRHRLSTIASVDTFRSSQLTSTNSEGTSVTETSSELSQTTLTHDVSKRTVSGKRHSDARTATQPSAENTRPATKRHLTKHSDLLSVLSLPDVPGASRSGSIKSARSVRTTRSRLDAATISDLLQELTDDETKYMRELKTLVDGVIPVLLSNVLKSKSAIDADSLYSETMRTSDLATKPIVDMGIALERLKSLHRRIPLQDPDRLISWAFQAHKTYEAYLASWRMGFQDVVVNLAPATSSLSSDEQSHLGMPRNSEGDVVNGDGERVDVAFLLKRPLVRVKHLAKLTKGFCNLTPSEETQQLSFMYKDLLDRVRRRTKEEQARQEDMLANNTDVTRVRSLLSLGPLDSVAIDRTRQVSAKDYFTLDLQHSNGQRIDCRVEILLRDKPKDPSDPGDILICEVDSTDRWLLFPPVLLTSLSACRGGLDGQVTVMVRKNDGVREQHEFFILTSDDKDTATEWIQLLGEDPTISSAKQVRNRGNPTTDAGLQLVKAGMPKNDHLDIPIGERSVIGKSPRPQRVQGAVNSAFSNDHVTDDTSWQNQTSFKYEMSGGLGVNEETKALRPSRYHQYSEPTAKRIPMDLHSSLPERLSKDSVSNSDRPAINRSRYHSRTSSAPVQKSSVEKEPPRSPNIDAGHTVEDDGPPPPPPAHRTPVTASIKDSLLSPPSPASKPRRKISSPLKHEYQPSDASATSESSNSEGSDGSCTESSDEEELEETDLSSALPGFNGYGKKISSSTSQASLATASLAPSNSASQAPFRGVPKQPDVDAVKLIASISCWNDKGRWDALYDGDCSIVIKPGTIEAFVMSASHSATKLGMHPQAFNSDTGEVRPLVALDLTPLVPLRQSNALDIEIRSPPLTISLLKCTGTIRFRARTVEDCRRLYAAIHHARLENPVYKRLEQERLVNSYGNQSYDKAVNGKRRTWLGRQRSYRASARAPSVSTSDNRSSGSFDSAISALKRFGNSGTFNISKSSVIAGSDGVVRSATTSLYTSSSDSSYTGITPPRTPNSESIAQSSMSKIMARGTRDIKIRLYKLETLSDWGHLGSCRLTIESPPLGMRQASTLYSGIEKRITVVSKSADSKSESIEAPNSHNRRMSWGGMLGPKKEAEEDEKSHILLDVVVGSYCVKKQGLTGIVINVWEDLVGDNGEVGMVGANGGLSGRTRKWLFQFATKDEASWIYVVLGGR